MSLTYAPYASGHVPFSIGLAPLDPARWIEPDERLAAELAAKEHLLATERDRVVRVEPGTEASQVEVRDALAQYLTQTHATLYRRTGDAIDIAPARRRVDLGADLPLVAAARLVQDDVCLMRRDAGGWRLAAAVLAAPSAWSLAEKFGQSLDGIHERVPGYAGQMANRMARIFDNLRPGKPVWRLNWSLYDDDVLFHPEAKSMPRRWSGPGGEFGEQAYIRVERQTLRKMPASGDILFTIRVYVDPVAAFRTHPDGRRLASALAERLAGLAEGQVRYKNLFADRERILAALRDMT